MADTTEIEKKSLEAHVELCAERYRALEASLAVVRDDVHELKTTAQQVHAMVVKMDNRRTTQVMSWGVGLIGFLVAALGYVVTHYVLK